tara:strand:- start:29852 stop:30886 length:1035 start_codon:yes stop_codon:yes gene_type:complete
MKITSFLPSIIFSVICLGIAALYAVDSGKPLATFMMLVVILSILEISLSFDNAVVNATVLEDMDERWRRYFLTWGILIAVFGMRLVFPILIVAVTANILPGDVLTMALDHPLQYAEIIASSHVEVGAFGGMFLLLVFLTFIFDSKKTLHWLQFIEAKFAEIGKLESVEIIFALLILLIAQSFLPVEARLGALTYGIGGVMLYVMVDSVSKFVSAEGASGIKRSGAMGFLYLEILDASFSFDGVLGAFAITTDIVVIMLGLAIGAMFVRNMTIFLVEQGTLNEYAFLEHGAHYAIGALALTMLTTMVMEIPELITGLTGIVIIGLSFYSSIQYRKRNKPTAIRKF